MACPSTAFNSIYLHFFQKRCLLKPVFWVEQISPGSFARISSITPVTSWWFQTFFMFTPKIGGRSLPFWRLHIFEVGWVQPPTKLTYSPWKKAYLSRWFSRIPQGGNMLVPWRVCFYGTIFPYLHQPCQMVGCFSLWGWMTLIPLVWCNCSMHLPGWWIFFAKKKHPVFALETQLGKHKETGTKNIYLGCCWLCCFFNLFM